VIVFALSTGHKLGLGLIALAWVIFSLLVSMVIPRYKPDFPGKRLPQFLALSALFFVAMLFAAFVFGKEPHEPAAAGHESPTLTQTGVTETTPSSTGGSVDLAAGRSAFDKAACGGCHTLAAANASGQVGPDLDVVKPSEHLVEETVRNGKGAMPPFKGVLSDTEIKAVAVFVSESAGKS
jgi:mono/diheme cytochrome c family protein